VSISGKTGNISGFVAENKVLSLRKTGNISGFAFARSLFLWG